MKEPRKRKCQQQHKSDPLRRYNGKIKLTHLWFSHYLAIQPVLLQVYLILAAEARPYASPSIGSYHL